MRAILDTNILLVANQQHDDISPECVSICAELLMNLERRGVIVIDSDFRIVGEYMKKTDVNPPKRPGDVFLKWLLRNMANSERVEQVDLNEPAPNNFDEFPKGGLQDRFDPPDRKFVAVSFAHPRPVPIFQAADCKWLDWWQQLLELGVVVHFTCGCDAVDFYRKKFPGRDVPQLPGNQPLKSRSVSRAP